MASCQNGRLKYGSSYYRVIDIREGFPKFMRVSPEGLALFLVEFVRVIREGYS